MTVRWQLQIEKCCYYHQQNKLIQVLAKCKDLYQFFNADSWLVPSATFSQNLSRGNMWTILRMINVALTLTLTLLESQYHCLSLSSFNSGDSSWHFHIFVWCVYSQQEYFISVLYCYYYYCCCCCKDYGSDIPSEIPPSGTRPIYYLLHM